MTFPKLTLANDIDVTEWCAWAAPQAWRNKRGAVEVYVEYKWRSPRPFLLAVRTEAQHEGGKRGKNEYLQLAFRTEVLPGVDPYVLARGYVRLITTLMGVDRKEVLYDGFAARGGVDRAGPAASSIA